MIEKLKKGLKYELLLSLRRRIYEKALINLKLKSLIIFYFECLNLLRTENLNLSLNFDLKIDFEKVLLILSDTDYKSIISINLFQVSDIGNIQKLLEILKGIKYICITMVSKSLGDDSLKQLKDMLLPLELISVKIRFDNNKIKLVENEIFPLFKSSNKLKLLEISINNNPINENGVNNLLYWISQMNHLEFLKLNLGIINLSSNSCYKIVNVIENLNQMTHLDLNISGNRLKNLMLEPVLNSIFNSTQLICLHLNLSKNIFNISDFNNIKNLIHLKTFSLNLGNCRRQDSDLIRLFTLIFNLKKLIHLSLNLESIFIFEEELFNLVKIIQSNKSIKSLKLYLNECNIGSSGAFFLAPLNYLSFLNSIYLDIRNNNIGYNTIEYLSKIFPKESISL